MPRGVLPFRNSTRTRLRRCGVPYSSSTYKRLNSYPRAHRPASRVGPPFIQGGLRLRQTHLVQQFTRSGEQRHSVLNTLNVSGNAARRTRHNSRRLQSAGEAARRREQRNAAPHDQNAARHVTDAARRQEARAAAPPDRQAAQRKRDAARQRDRGDAARAARAPGVQVSDAVRAAHTARGAGQQPRRCRHCTHVGSARSHRTPTYLPHPQLPSAPPVSTACAHCGAVWVGPAQPRACTASAPVYSASVTPLYRSPPHLPLFQAGHTLVFINVN